MIVCDNQVVNELANPQKLWDMKNGLLLSDLFFNLYDRSFEEKNKRNLEFFAKRFSQALHDIGYPVKMRDLIADYNARL